MSTFIDRLDYIPGPNRLDRVVEHDLSTWEPIGPHAIASTGIQTGNPEEGMAQLSKLDQDLVAGGDFHWAGKQLFRRIDPLHAEKAVPQFNEVKWVPHTIYTASQSNPLVTAEYHALMTQLDEEEEAARPWDYIDALDRAPTSVDDYHTAKEMSEIDFRGGITAYTDYLADRELYEEMLELFPQNVRDKYEMRWNTWDQNRERNEEWTRIDSQVKVHKSRERNCNSIIDRIGELADRDQYKTHRARIMELYKLDKEWRNVRRECIENGCTEPMNVMNKWRQQEAEEALQASMDALLCVDSRPHGSKLNFSRKQWTRIFDAYNVAWRRIVPSQWFYDLRKNDITSEDVINIAKGAKANLKDWTYKNNFRPEAIERLKELRAKEAQAFLSVVSWFVQFSQ